MKLHQAFAFVTLLVVHICGLKIDCDNPDGINEDHIHYCCKHPEKPNKVLEDCSKETGFKWPNPKEEAFIDITPDRAIAGTCFSKCVFNKLNFIKGEDFNMEAVRKYYSDNHSNDPEYVKEMLNAFDHCHGKSEDNAAKFLSNPMFKTLSDDFCEPKSSVILACVIRQFFHNCPIERWSKSPECDRVLEFSKSCKDALISM
ncbi:general odorant-binding protein 66-like [Teleopsis dalmanni]|uniref:general odorant-binding protein 66-like n=1 Tax=Teleopsis dalmanni TaxID=139649 RepID=UPI0018CF43F0|nr:general odorant-binding protein 66-like [Teleopsis dalmanni]